MAEATMLRTMIDIVSQSQLVDAAKALKFNSVDNLTFMRVNAYESVDRIPELSCAVSFHGEGDISTLDLIEQALPWKTRPSQGSRRSQYEPRFHPVMPTVASIMKRSGSASQ